MLSRNVTLPDVGLIAVTRAALGLGVGLLIADRFAPEQRRAVGWTLVTVGAVTTFPLLANFLGRRTPGSLGNGSQPRAREPAGVASLTE